MSWDKVINYARDINLMGQIEINNESQSIRFIVIRATDENQIRYCLGNQYSIRLDGRGSSVLNECNNDGLIMIRIDKKP